MANSSTFRWQNNLLLVRQESASLIVAQAPHKRQCCDGRLLTNNQVVRTHTVDRSGASASGGEHSIVQNHVEQRFMDRDATVIFNKAEFAEAIHEEADA